MIHVALFKLCFQMILHIQNYYCIKYHDFAVIIKLSVNVNMNNFRHMLTISCELMHCLK